MFRPKGERLFTDYDSGEDGSTGFGNLCPLSDGHRTKKQLRKVREAGKVALPFRWVTKVEQGDG